MNHVEPCDSFCLVSLDMPDEMPAHGNGRYVDFWERFLNPIFADVPQAGVPRCLNRVRAVRLGDGNDRNALAVPASLGGAFDLLTNVPKSIREVRKRHKL